MTSSRTAPIAEIFVSDQGEGLYCGQRQIFIRFAGCNLNCSYCDEPAARKADAARRMTLRQILKIVDSLRASDHPEAVSLTGGEPLLFPAFLNHLIPALKRRGLQAHLETNGTLPQAYAKLKTKPAVVAADIKLPSATKKQFWNEHLRFLKLCRGNVFVKTVLDSRATSAEVERVIATVAQADKHIPLFWQPCTPSKKEVRPPSPAFVKKALRLARAKLSAVRVLRQMHVMWGVK